ncbi:MAG: hypothetical protein ACI8XO_002674 [Verrucomicrobiales bacterium]|jgi:hypothetical protein
MPSKSGVYSVAHAGRDKATKAYSADLQFARRHSGDESASVSWCAESSTNTASRRSPRGEAIKLVLESSQLLRADWAIDLPLGSLLGERRFDVK